jgi:copper chaperone CopZ
VRGSLKKLSGVEDVEVSLNKGSASIKFKSPNSIRAQDIWDIIKRNGFTPKEAAVVVRGEIVNDSKLQIKVTGSNQIFELTGDKKILDQATHRAGKAVTVEGALAPPKDPREAIPLLLRSLREE